MSWFAVVVEGELKLSCFCGGEFRVMLFRDGRCTVVVFSFFACDGELVVFTAENPFDITCGFVDFDNGVEGT